MEVTRLMRIAIILESMDVIKSITIYVHEHNKLTFITHTALCVLFIYLLLFNQYFDVLLIIISTKVCSKLHYIHELSSTLIYIYFMIEN